MIFKFNFYRFDPIYVHQSLFNWSPTDEDEALDRLVKVYRNIDLQQEPRKLYDQYVDALDFECSIMDIDCDPMSYEEFIADMSVKANEKIDGEILRARDKLDEILNSPNQAPIVNRIKQQLKYTSVNDNNREEIISQMYDYMNKIMPITYDEIESKLIITPKIGKVLKDVRMILDEQLHSLKEKRPCQLWYIDSYHNGLPFGSIIVYYNKEVKHNYVMIQNITKYPIPTLVQMLFPEYNKYMPRLNSVLMEPINTVARDLEVDYIYVHPLEEQAVQLEKHYGFRLTDKRWELPCSTISPTLNKKAYYKEVEK